MTKRIFTLVAFICSITLHAHTVWLETSTSGKINKQHEVKVFFGEPDSPTFTEKWFSDLKDLEIKLIAPSGKEQNLTKTQKESHYVAFFTPSEKGVYKVLVNHLVKDVFKEMKITYKSVAFVSVGEKETKELTLGSEPLQMSFDTAIPKVEKEKVFKFFNEGKVAEKQSVKITSQNGWGMGYRTNNKGEIKFKPLWKGKFLVEFSSPKKQEGEHNGKLYKTDYQTINYLIEIK